MWLHGWQGTTGSSSCADHQDWCSWETVVLAFAVSGDGMRVMVQLTFRVRGKGEAQRAADYLRENVFGDPIAPSSD